MAPSQAMPTLADRAITWFDASARDLPWRRAGTTAWGILVSEVMLQQTPVVRVEPAYLSWLRRWPTPADLATEPAGEAIRAWGRLGYPRRALRLHACATTVVARHGGEVPADLGDLLALPGIGTYTARAVAAFAYGQRHPVVDVNVRRVLARAVAGRPDCAPATSAADLVTAEALLPTHPARAVRASAALMELGALVCTARTPACDDCPLRPVCRWRAAGPSPDTDTAAPTSGARRRSPGYAGTDRQVRGLLLGMVRDSSGPVSRADLDALWTDADQRSRALDTLVRDGLLVQSTTGRYALP